MTEEAVEVATESGVEVEVIDDTPEEDRVAPRDQEAAADFDISEDEIGQYSDRVQKRIKRLKYEFHEQRRARETAERQNQEAVAHAQRIVQENRELKSLLQRGNEALFKATEAKTDSELQMAEKDFREAYEAGDTDRIVDAQKRVNDAQFSRRSVEDMRPVQAEQAPVAQAQPQQQEYVPPPDPRAIEWLRENPWFGQDKEMTSFAYGLHEKLVVDERVRQVFPDHFDGGEPPREEAPRKSVVAPATRAGKAPRKVSLTQSQVDLAKKLGVTTEQYANQIAKDMAHGR